MGERRFITAISTVGAIAFALGMWGFHEGYIGTYVPLEGEPITPILISPFLVASVVGWMAAMMIPTCVIISWQVEIHNENPRDAIIEIKPVEAVNLEQLEITLKSAEQQALLRSDLAINEHYPERLLAVIKALPRYYDVDEIVKVDDWMFRVAADLFTSPLSIHRASLYVVENYTIKTGRWHRKEATYTQRAVLKIENKDEVRLFRPGPWTTGFSELHRLAMASNEFDNAKSIKAKIANLSNHFGMYGDE